MTLYAALGWIAAAFTAGHWVGWLRARAVLSRIRAARAQGLIPEARGENLE